MSRLLAAVRWRVRRVLRFWRARLGQSEQRSGLGRPRIHERESRTNHYDAVDLLRAIAVRQANGAVIEEVRDRVRGASAPAVRIAFLVTSPARWNATQLARSLAEHGRFEVSVHVFPPIFSNYTPEQREAEHQDSLEFFRGLGHPVVNHLDAQGSVIPVEDIECDVAFLEMPWGMKDFPRRLLGKALSAYMHYGFMMMANHEMHYNIASFHSYLWRYYTQTEGHRRMHLRHDATADARIRVVGYPKLDAYLEHTGLQVADGERTIIYAPHHSLGKDNLGMSTFPWSRTGIADLRAEHPSLRWMLKPHPGMRSSVVRNKVMSAEEYDEYLASWARDPSAEVYESGEYFDLFRRSAALITCSGSFLAEYLPTGRPIIHLDSGRSVGFNDVGQVLARGFYRVRSNEELKQVFRDVVVDGNDPLEHVRRELIAELLPAGGTASERIVEDLEATFLR